MHNNISASSRMHYWRHLAESIVAALPELFVSTKNVAESLSQGIHARRRFGKGDSFWQFRPYQLGDSRNRIDWRRSAKSDIVYVREYEWEIAQTVYLWRDRSPSMTYSSSTAIPTKRNRADLLILSLAILLKRSGERPILIDERTYDNKKQTRISIEEIAQAISGDEALHVDDQLLTQITLPTDSTIVWMSDFLTPLSTFEKTIAYLTKTGVLGHVLQIADPAEESLPFSDRVIFLGTEGEESTLVPRVDVIKQAYQETIKDHRTALNTIASKYGWTFGIHRTDRSATQALLSLCTTLSAY